MRVAYFDAIGGAAGDMILGALLDAGLDLEHLRHELNKLPLQGYAIRTERVRKQHISATQFLVDIDSDDDHSHDGEDMSHGRPLAEILRLVDNSPLAERVKDRAAAMFRRLGEAEARIHGVPLEGVHFHEVGAIDSIVDVVGSAIGFEIMGFEAIYCSPLPLGSGLIETRHGTYPLPAPATLEILAAAGAPTRPSPAQREQVTPTGAAILATAATFEQPPMRVLATGYGSGESDLDIPNILRLWIGESSDIVQEDLNVLESNVDDMAPELLAGAVARLFEAGALDVWLTAALMKKGRPGNTLHVLCLRSDRGLMVDLVLRETSTLGVRAYPVQRYAAPRRIATVQTAYGPVSVKLKALDGRVIGVAPEYEDCARLAREAGIPVAEAYAAAAAAGRSLLASR